MIDPSSAMVDMLAVTKSNYAARSLPSMDLEDLQEWVEGAGDD